MHVGWKNGDILKQLVRIEPDGCWRWVGKIHKKTGYGYKQWFGRSVLAHRWMYSIFNGYVHDDMAIDHLCRNRWCVNPAHLEPTTFAENCRRGNGTKLTPTQVLEIKEVLSNVSWGQRKKIAEKYGVSPGLISDIKYGRAWADINIGSDQ